MSRPGNSYLTRRIRAAIAAGIRPCAMVFRVQPNREWEDLDFKLLEANQILEDETCPKCGQFVWLCRNTSNDVEWSTNSVTCYATKALEEKQEGRKNKKDKKATPAERAAMGRIDFAVPRVPSNRKRDGVENLPTRTEYYESLNG